ncbi:MAG: hypothetical protein F4165_01610, partial [Acidimicrobiia bacterium]|nr:hypothetical protein [Acidimicrobiia bacterium]
MNKGLIRVLACLALIATITAIKSSASASDEGEPATVSSVDCEARHQFGTGDWYSPDGTTCVLANYFPNEDPALSFAIQLWRTENPDQYQDYLNRAIEHANGGSASVDERDPATRNSTTTAAAPTDFPSADFVCTVRHGFGTGDWYSPDRRTCALVNYFPGESPAFGAAIELWRTEDPDLYQSYLDRIPAPATPNRYQAVVASGQRTCGLRVNGTINCWGGYSYERSEPPEGTFTSIAASDIYMCALATDQTIACWG